MISVFLKNSLSESWKLGLGSSDYANFVFLYLKEGMLENNRMASFWAAWFSWHHPILSIVDLFAIDDKKCYFLTVVGNYF